MRRGWLDGSSVVVREFCKVGATVVDERTPGCAFGVDEGAWLRVNPSVQWPVAKKR